MNNTYYLMRHGQTPYQKELHGTIYPHPENPPILLTKEGEEQVHHSGEKLKDEEINMIFCSPFNRTRRTSEIVREYVKAPIKFDKRLVELDMGDLKGKPQSEYQKHFKNYEDRFKKPIPGGEGIYDMQKRLIDFFTEIDKKYNNKKILVISHGDPLWIMECYLKGITKKEEMVDLRWHHGFRTAQFKKI